MEDAVVVADDVQSSRSCNTPIEVDDGEDDPEVVQEEDPLRELEDAGLKTKAPSSSPKEPDSGGDTETMTSNESKTTDSRNIANNPSASTLTNGKDTEVLSVTDVTKESPVDTDKNLPENAAEENSVSSNSEQKSEDSNEKVANEEDLGEGSKKNSSATLTASEDGDEVTILDEEGPTKEPSSSAAPFHGIFGGDVLPIELESLTEIQLCHDVYGPGHMAVQFTRLHCTACNIHLGSAVHSEEERYIHPLLKVIVCKQCYYFYCSGEFEKDEDGSELYCRWCGQGGKVLCCSNCAYVFCQKCVRHNKGKKGLDIVKASDDWLCFVCDSDQLTSLRIQCRALYDFLLQEKSRLADNSELLKTDYSCCCQNRGGGKPAPPKRKRIDPEAEDENYSPMLDNIEPVKKRKNSSSLLQRVLASSTTPLVTPAATPDKDNSATWNIQTEDEVECTPDLPFFMEEEDDLQSAQQVSSQESSAPPPLAPLGHTSPSTVSAAATTGVIYPFGQKANQGVSKSPPTYRLIASTPAPNVTVGVNNTSVTKSFLPVMVNTTVKHQSPPKLTPISQMKKSGSANKFVTVANSGNTSVIDAVPSRVIKGSKQEWFERATHLAKRVNENLSQRLQSLAAQQAKAESLEQLASVHNSLQEILSNSINSLIQVRKNLRSEFINGIRNLNNNQSGNEVIDLESANNKNDDDVRIVETPKFGDSSRPYLKVKSFAQIMGNNAVSKNVISKTTNGPVKVISAGKTPVNKQQLKVPPIKIKLPTPLLKKATSVSKPKRHDRDSDCGIDTSFNTDAASLVKQAVRETTFDQLVAQNMEVLVEGITRDELKDMLSVRVFVEKDYGDGTPRSMKVKNFRPIRIIRFDKLPANFEDSVEDRPEVCKENGVDTMTPSEKAVQSTA